MEKTRAKKFGKTNNCFTHSNSSPSVRNNRKGHKKVANTRKIPHNHTTVGIKSEKPMVAHLVSGVEGLSFFHNSEWTLRR